MAYDSLIPRGPTFNAAPHFAAGGKSNAPTNTRRRTAPPVTRPTVAPQTAQSPNSLPQKL